MTDLRTAAQQALEALENGKRVRSCEGGTKFQIPLEDNALTALRAALAQQDEPVEPVAWLYEEGADSTLHWNKPPLYGTPLYTSPPKRQPQTLDAAMQQPRAMAQAYENGYKAGVAHERERCLRLIDDHVRAVDSEDVVRAIKEVQG